MATSKVETTDTTRALNGAGILALTHGGKFDHEPARKAGDWILDR